MPKKGEKLTEEHKKAMAEGRARQAAAAAAEEAAHESATEDLDAKKAADQQAAMERAEATRRAMLDEDLAPPVVPGPAVHAPTFEPKGDGRAQGVSEWGPYDNYVLVETPYGRYAVEPGYVMFFEPYQFFDDREKRMRTSHRPVYVWAREGPDKGKTRDELVRGLRPGQRSEPKIVQPIT